MEIRIFKYECIYLLVLAVLGLHCHVGFSLVVAGGDHSLAGGVFFCCGGRAFGASVVTFPRLVSTGSLVVHRNLVAPWHVESSQTRDQIHAPLHWQVDSFFFF